MWLYLALASAIVFALAGMFFKEARLSSINSSSFFFFLYAGGSVAIGVYTIVTYQFEISFSLLLSGFIIGTSLSLGNYLFIKSLDDGPLSLTSPIININIVFLVIWSSFQFNESITKSQYILILLLIISVLILPIDPSEKLKIKNNKWYLLVLLASFFFAIRNGGLKVTSEFGLNNNNVLFYSYLIPAIAFFFLKPKEMLFKRKTISLGTIGGVLSVAGMILYSYALERGPSSIVIPIFSTYNVFIVLGGYLFFKERLTFIQKLSVGLVIISTLLLKSI